jgi:hypothetical protein
MIRSTPNGTSKGTKLDEVSAVFESQEASISSIEVTKQNPSSWIYKM